MTRLYEALGRVELGFAQACVVLMTLLVLVSATARTAGSPLSWTVDLATFLFAWAVFVGADVAWRRDRMVTIDLLVVRLPARPRTGVRLLNDVVIAVFLVAMVVTGTQLAGDAADRSFSGLPWLSYTWVTLSMPVGCLLMLATTLRRIRGDVAALRTPAEPGPAEPGPAGRAPEGVL
ncbi:TRAP transporter small permease [Promicromonospora panici]|uniref:TRAP transporter small permease n=1 Tax=Promicromonospora panici TaxID=2219658 RepID=UPI00101C3221|nr:TRAP transporter small permease [Promicromonospora panici]